MEILKWKGLEVDPRKIHESTTAKPRILPENKLAFQEGRTEGGSRFLLPRIEAIHAGTTRNNTRYMEDKLKGDPLGKSGVYSWMHPYPKPVIYNHDINTEATGRVYSASFVKETKAGRPGLIVIPKITDEKAIQGILDSRLLTVSIGATTDSAVCSICGTDIIEEGWCGHDKGGVYDGHTCDWIIGQVFFDELSWVNVPADSDAMVTDVGEALLAEAFASTSEGIINLGKNKSEWLITQESAKQNGLIGTEEGDLNTLPTVEELQAQLEAAQNANTQLTTQLEKVTSEKSDLEGQLEAANATIEAKDAELQTKTQELTEKDAAIASKDQELAEATTQKTEAEAKVAELTATVEGLQTEKESLQDNNTNLSAEMHKLTAERVVDLKVVLGKVTTREEALEQHVGRSSESLKDSLVDLLNEASSITSFRAPATVTNPGTNVLNDGKEKNVQGSKTVTENEKPEEMTKEKVLTKLFGGK